MKFAVSIATAVAALVIFSPGVVFGGNSQVKDCKVTPQAVAMKREATWKWQKQAKVDRTPTRYLERRANTCVRLRYLMRLWAERAHRNYKLVQRLESRPRFAIRWVFGRYSEQALNVAWCESRLSVWAQNGQYLGLFQMGSYERQVFGHGTTAIAQARAAHRYFVRSGRDWSPWSCNPW